jgi:hypothetical protein
MGLKKMNTKWGSCNAESGHNWLNLELIKKPVSCLEYIIVHELTHFHERHHNDRFIVLMDRYLPSWRLRRDELSAAPLGHDDWDYLSQVRVLGNGFMNVMRTNPSNIFGVLGLLVPIRFLFAKFQALLYV